LKTKLAGLTPEQASAKLQELTKGAGGTIQAMRFLNLAINDTNGLFPELTNQVNNSSGTMSAAYQLMFAQPASQAQLFTNNLDVLKTEIGDVLLPALNKFLSKAIELLQWFENLDPKTKKVIVLISVAAFSFLTLAGIVLILIGALLI